MGKGEVSTSVAGTTQHTQQFDKKAAKSFSSRDCPLSSSSGGEHLEIKFLIVRMGQMKALDNESPKNWGSDSGCFLFPQTVF